MSTTRVCARIACETSRSIVALTGVYWFERIGQRTRVARRSLCLWSASVSLVDDHALFAVPVVGLWQCCRLWLVVEYYAVRHREESRDGDRAVARHHT